MIAKTVVVSGTLRPDGSTLELDERISLPPGRVRVRLEALSPPRPSEDLRELLERIWAARQAREAKPRTAEEIDAEIKALRDEADDEMREVEALQESIRRARGQD